MKKIFNLITLLLTFALPIFSQNCEWTAQSSGTSNNLTSVHFIDENTGWAVGDLGTIRKTTNAGENWSNQSSGTNNLLLSVFFIDQNVGWICGGNGIIRKTTNGGTNWVSQTSGTTSWLRDIFFINENTGWAVGQEETILKTTNGGSTWSTVQTDLQNDLLSVFFTDENTGWAVGYEGTVKKTTNGGDTWFAQSIGTYLTMTSVFFVDENTGLIAGENGLMKKTTNGGSTWSNILIETEENINSIFLVENYGWSITNNGEIHFSTDGGNSWNFQDSDAYENLYTVHFVNAANGWAVGANGTIVNYHCEEPIVLDTPILITPVNYTTNILADEIYFSWNEVENAETYIIQLAQNENFEDCLEFWIEETYFTAYALEFATTYFWRVLAANDDAESQWSEVWQFTTEAGPFLPAPNLLLPANGAVLRNPNNLNFSWNLIDGATYYSIEVADNIDFEDSWIEWTQENNYTFFNFYAHTTYFWRVIAANDETESEWSGSWQFTTAKEADWKWKNPVSTSNKLNEIMFVDAINGWAVGDFGTIIKTSDGGDNWELLTTAEFPNLRCLFFVNSQVGWVAGERGLILKTSDAGQNWIQQNEISSTLNNIYDIHFTDEMNGWAVGGWPNLQQVLLKTTDGGDNWVAQPQMFATSIRRVFFLNSNIGWIVFNLGMTFKTTDAGQTWTQQTFSADYPNKIFFIDENTGWVSCSNGNIYKTTNSGFAWSSQSVPTNEPIFDLYFLNQNNGWAIGGNSTFLKTTDGGANWISQPIPIFENYTSISVINESTFWAAGYNGIILKTTNAGQNWTEQRKEVGFELQKIQPVDEYNIFATGPILAAGGSNVLLKSTDSGNNWTAVNVNTSSNARVQSVHFISPQTGWVTDFYGHIYRTTDSGDSWVRQTTQSTGAANDIFFANQNDGWVVGIYGAVYRTVNGGVDWTAQNSQSDATLNRIFFTSSTNGWIVGNNGTIRKTTNGGSTWVPIEITYLNLNDVFFINDDFGWIVGDEGKILHTTDAGATWQDLSLPDAYYSNYSVYFTNEFDGWLTNGYGNIYKTTDGGNSFNLLENTTDKKLFCISFINEEKGWAAGEAGTILKYDISSDYELNPPQLISPENYAENIEIDSINLIWSGVQNAEWYDIEISASIDFENAFSFSTDETNYVVNNLNFSTIYYWRVKASDGDIISAWSEVWSFTTVSAPQYIDINLNQGWNTISSNIIPNAPNMEDIFAEMDELVIVKNAAGQIFEPAQNINQIGDWNIAHGYMVYITAPATLQITGTAVDPTETEINLVSGWNLVSYLRNSPLAISTALEGINNSLILVKNNLGQLYYPAYGLNTIGNMQQGQGYWIYMSSPAVLTYPGN